MVVSTCTNDKCKLWGSSVPNLVLEALSQTERDLVRTRKALDVAVKRLGYIKDNYKSWTPDRDAQMIAQAVNGIDEIKKTLEQKDVK